MATLLGFACVLALAGKVLAHGGIDYGTGVMSTTFQGRGSSTGDGENCFPGQTNAAFCARTTAPCGGQSAESPTGKVEVGQTFVLNIMQFNSHCTGSACDSNKYTLEIATSEGGSYTLVENFTHPTDKAVKSDFQKTFTMPSGIASSNNGVLKLTFDTTANGGEKAYSCADVVIIGTDSGGPSSSGPSAGTPMPGAPFDCATCKSEKPTFEQCNPTKSGCECIEGFFSSDGECICNQAYNAGLLCQNMGLTYEKKFNGFSTTGGAMRWTASIGVMMILAMLVII